MKIRITIEVSIDEVAQCKLAIKLFDMKLGKNYDDCLKAAVQSHGKEGTAIQILSKM